MHNEKGAILGILAAESMKGVFTLRAMLIMFSISWIVIFFNWKQVFPDRSKEWDRQVDLLANQGQYQQALAKTNQYLKAHPHSSDVYRLQHGIYLQMNNTEAAERSWKKYLQMEAKYPLADEVYLQKEERQRRNAIAVN